MRSISGFGFLLTFAACAALAQQGAGGSAVPNFKDLETAGAVIGEIRIDNQNVFDLTDPREDNALFRAANATHIRTRPGVIRDMLLFRSGEAVSVQLIEESERLLRGNNYIYDVTIRPLAYHEGIVDIEVKTRDAWTLSPGIKLGRAGGSNTSGIGLSERNLLGTGTSVGVERTNDVDRSGREFFFSRNNALDGWTSVEYRHANFDDGTSTSAAVNRPFYALDTRRAAGVSASKSDRIDSVYSGGNIVSQYHHQTRAGEIYGGVSPGLVDGWTHRYSGGIRYKDDTYTNEPGLSAPAQLPADQKNVGPFFRYEVVEDDFLKVKNRNLIERTEHFELGFHSTLQLGRAMTQFGSTRDLWQYSANLSDGWVFQGDHNFLATARANGQYGSGGGEHQFFGAGAKYFRPQRGRGLLFASAAVDTVANGDVTDILYLGGDNGLRGYPLRYQSGTHRALFSVEQRGYTDWYPFRLFRVGGAVFMDYGRAWGGDVSQNTANPGWLADVGFGLRILNDRSATGKVIHIDFAFPLNRDPSIKSWQFLVKSYVNF